MNCPRGCCFDVATKADGISTSKRAVRIFILNWSDSSFQLASILGRIEVALGGSNQAVASDTPSFKAANADPVPRPPWPGVRAGKSPVILGFVGLEPKVIHDHAKIREGSHE